MFRLSWFSLFCKRTAQFGKPPQYYLHYHHNNYDRVFGMPNRNLCFVVALWFQMNTQMWFSFIPIMFFTFSLHNFTICLLYIHYYTHKHTMQRFPCCSLSNIICDVAKHWSFKPYFSLWFPNKNALFILLTRICRGRFMSRSLITGIVCYYKYTIQLVERKCKKEKKNEKKKKTLKFIN